MTEDFYLGNEVCWKENNSGKEIDTSVETQDIYDKMGIPKLLAKILNKRGFRSQEEIKSYLKPSIKNLHDPILLPDMQLATDRILDAMNNAEKVIIYGDYDVDGITATSILYLFLKTIIKDVSFYIPDRVDEGYGISAEAVDFLTKNHYDLMITVDCGISAKDRFNQIQSEKERQNKNMDIIITDHHQADPKNMPDVLAIINPHLGNSEYPFSKLCGAGVAFKLVQALCTCLGYGDKFLEYVDLAALGTVADIVSLTGENRVIVWAGIAKIQRRPNPGIEALLKTSDIKTGKFDSSKLAFMLAPRINAAGRMGDASRGVKLFSSTDATEAEILAKELNTENYKRQKIQEEILQNAVAAIEADYEYYNQRVIVVSGDGWHHGVIGIVASMLSERYNKPCFVISVTGEIATCSARSKGELNIYSAMEHCRELLERYGGHEKAGGLTIKTENIELFTGRINEYATNTMPDIPELPCINVDAEILIEEISINAVEAIMAMAPFGEENEAPVFRMNQVPLLQKKRIGASGDHLRLLFGTNQNPVQAIAFRMGEMDNFIELHETFDLVFTIGINEFNGNRNVQLNIKAIRQSSDRVQKNKIMLEAAEKVECLDYNEEWLYNGINNKRLKNEDITLTREELAVLYRYLHKCGSCSLTRTDLFRIADELKRSESRLNYFKLLSGLFVFDELDIIQFTYTDSGEYSLLIPEVIEKASLDSSMLFSFLQSIKHSYLS